MNIFTRDNVFGSECGGAGGLARGLGGYAAKSEALADERERTYANMSSMQTTLSCDQKRKASSCGLSVREIILLIYSCGISFLFFSKSVCDCSLSQKRVLISDTRITNNDYNSSDTDWVQQHIIGRNNFPPSSVEFPLIFKHGFTYDERKMCRGHNKTKCNSTLFKHSKQADTLHGDRLIYSPYELGKYPISVDQICQVREGVVMEC